ncbi:MAG: hypothetical protein JNM93_11260 [Bacteriovoracaceae bacterium]|nr:hypothetical protein [Bacteriovoracaceae bacterium]
MSTLVLTLLFNLSLHAQEEAFVIDYAATYSCEGSYEYYEMENGVKTNLKTEAAKTNIFFELEETYATVYMEQEDFALRVAFVPNYNACERVFESKEMVLNLHAVALSFNSVRCKQDRLYASYFVAGLYGSSNAYVDLRLTSAETVEYYSTDFDYQDNGNYIVHNEKLSCKKLPKPETAPVSTEETK